MDSNECGQQQSKLELRKQLTEILNGYENPSNTPDFILADYLVGCLENFDAIMQTRAKWYSELAPQSVAAEGDL